VIMIQPHGLVAFGPVFRWPRRVPAVDAPK
jgi:hypothetical protein